MACAERIAVTNETMRRRMTGAWRDRVARLTLTCLATWLLAALTLGASATAAAQAPDAAGTPGGADGTSASPEQGTPEVPPVARALGLAFWAGPLTLILPKKPIVPDSVTAGLPTVAVRVPAHRVARALMETSGVPVAAPSANRFSRPSPTQASHVLQDLDGRIDLVVDAGPTPIGVESTIVDCTQSPPKVLREGAISPAEIAAALGAPVAR